MRELQLPQQAACDCLVQSNDYVQCGPIIRPQLIQLIAAASYVRFCNNAGALRYDNGCNKWDGLGQ